MKYGRLAVAVTFIITIALLLTGYSLTRRAETAELRVLCAGSLAIPLEEVAEAFESENFGVKVVVEPSGSLLAIRKITELGKSADILVVSDSNLIQELMIPEHADFYISFASNELVLAYTDVSRYSDDVNSDNWFKVLTRPDVKYGIANPNDDPCGYRSLMALALAEEHYGEEGLFQRLIAEKSNILFSKTGKNFQIYVPLDFGPKHGSNLIVRSKAEDLVPLLKSGMIDYAFQYKSVAAQHGLRYVELPAEIALGDPRLSDFYRSVTIFLFYGSEKQEVVVGQPIMYGLTVPKSCKNRDLAIKFINFMLSEDGKAIFEGHFHSFLEKFEVVGEPPLEIEAGR